VSLSSPGFDPILFDLGTGLRFFGETQPLDGSFRGHVLLSHLHWDHIQGLPFFVPIDRPGARLDIYGPAQEHGRIADAIEEFMQPPYFPIRWTDLRGDITFHDIANCDIEIDGAVVRVRDCPHIGPTNGYRVERDGVSVAYLSDHQAPFALDTVAESVLETCSGVDLLIHDAQYVDEEWDLKAHWGHCTVGYALRVAHESEVKRLALFHHDPAHGDEWVDRIVADARRKGERWGIEVFAAKEGQKVVLDASDHGIALPASGAEQVGSRSGRAPE
jgi:phosphoribosyl 1,2-cyclic phosphodiesterase